MGRCNNEIHTDKNAFTKNGVVHGNNDIAGLYVNVKIWVANKPIKPITTLQKTIGIKKTGFNITGIPKINGSLILNKLGIKANFSRRNFIIDHCTNFIGSKYFNVLSIF